MFLRGSSAFFLFVLNLPFNLKTFYLHLPLKNFRHFYQIIPAIKITSFMPEIKAISANRLSFRIQYDSISSEVTGHTVGAIASCSISYIR